MLISYILYEHAVHKIRLAYIELLGWPCGRPIGVAMHQPQRAMLLFALGAVNQLPLGVALDGTSGFAVPPALVRFASIIILSANLIVTVGLQKAYGRPAGDGRSSWLTLAPLPDSVGYGGMFCGVLNGTLIAGGGSQFRDLPLWLDGEKVFSDRMFALASAKSQWVESPRRLPYQAGHFASVATRDAVYLVGGVNSTGCLANVARITADGDSFVFNELPSLPHPLGYAAGAIVNDRLYVVGGLASVRDKHASKETWSLSLSRQPEAISWRREPDLPGPGVHVASAAADQNHIYLIGGIGFDKQGLPVPTQEVYCLSPGSKTWKTVPSMPAPRVGAVSPCPVIDGQICVIGGYAEVFPGAPREHPGFCRETFIFDPQKQSWRLGQPLPMTPVANRDLPGDSGPKPMIAAPCCEWEDSIVIVGGEVRSSVRTPAVIALPADAALKSTNP